MRAQPEHSEPKPAKKEDIGSPKEVLKSSTKERLTEEEIQLALKLLDSKPNI